MARGGSRATDRPAGALRLAAFGLLALAWLGQGTAEATFPGENGQIAFGSGVTIRAVNPDGSAETFLTCRPREVMAQDPVAGENPLSAGAPVWSADGRRIAFSRAIPGGGPAAGELTWLFTLNPNGSENRFGSGTASWSPDGERIAAASGEEYFWGDYYPSVLVVASRDGSDKTTLAEGGNQPAWSPDGERIAFMMRDPEAPDGPSDIWTVRPDGSDPVNLTDGPAFESSPAWSPDGNRIAFQRRQPESSDPEVWVMNGDGSGQSLLAERAAGPHWSPNGSGIAFWRDGDIWVMDADGSGSARLTTGGAARSFRWSPDSRRIAFGRDGDIWVMNADGTDATPLVRGSSERRIGSFDWQPIPPSTDGNPGPSQFCFTALRRDTNRGIASLVVEVSRPGRVVLRRGPGVRPIARDHRETGAGRVVLPIRPRGRAKRKLERRATARLPVRLQVIYRPRAGEPRTRSGRIWLVKAPRRCRDVNNERVRVIRIQATLGCKRIRRLAARTVYRNSYFGVENRRFSCAWKVEDPASFPKVKVKGSTYRKGYCQEKRSRLKVSFLGLRKKTDLWGRVFLSTAVTEDGKPRALVPGTGIRVYFRSDDAEEGRGRVEFSAGCWKFGPFVKVTARRLRTGRIFGDSEGCAKDLQRQDEWLRDFFVSDPRWRLRDPRRLVLRSAGTVIRLRDRG